MVKILAILTIFDKKLRKTSIWRFFNSRFDILGQKSQGPETAAEVNFMLKGKNMENQFPLFTAVHRIFINQMQPEEFIDTLRNHPVHADRNYSQL